MPETRSKLAEALASRIVDQFPSVNYIEADEFARVIDERLAAIRAVYEPEELARCPVVSCHKQPCSWCVTAAMRAFILLPEQL